MIRLGRISYVNMAPVFYRLDADVEEVQGVPTDLNGRLLAGDLDAIGGGVKHALAFADRVVDLAGRDVFARARGSYDLRH